MKFSKTGGLTGDSRELAVSPPSIAGGSAPTLGELRANVLAIEFVSIPQGIPHLYVGEITYPSIRTNH